MLQIKSLQQENVSCIEIRHSVEKLTRSAPGQTPASSTQVQQKAFGNPNPSPHFVSDVMIMMMGSY